jgi:4-hydroxy-2-oxoheptanedioate aldolase
VKVRDLKIKSKLQQRQPAGVISGHQNTDMVDFLGQFGLDGVWIECEHGPVDWDEIGDFSRACDLWNMASIVRVPIGEPWVITRTLDRGASGIVVPHVNNRQTAEKVVQAAKFGPIGQRGMYGSRRSYGVQDYFKKANDETVVIVLIEEIDAVNNLSEILKVDHIDVFFVAPSDLAQTMGHTGNIQHPEVQATIDRSIKQIVDAGRNAGTLASDESLGRYLDMGVTFTLTSWLPWAAKGAIAYRDALNSRSK